MSLVIYLDKLCPEATLDCSQQSKNIPFFFLLFFFPYVLKYNSIGQQSPLYICIKGSIGVQEHTNMNPWRLVQTDRPSVMRSDFLKVEDISKDMYARSYALLQLQLRLKSDYTTFHLSLSYRSLGFFPESVTTFQLKMLSSQDQMKSFGSFHILLLILWIILSFLCTFCLISLKFLNCSEFLA